MQNQKEEVELAKARRLSIQEGSATSVMSGITADYITPFALALKSTNFHIGLLNSISGLLPPIAQIFGSRLLEKYSRKKIIVNFVTLQALTWLPIAFLAIFFWKNIFTSYLPWLLIIFYTLYAILGSFAGPAWFSLMGDLVPEKIRGKYFGKRNKICGTITIIFALLASFFLDYFKTKGLLLLAFSILFILAGIFRLISSALFKKHYEPKFKLNHGYYFSILQFIKKAPSNNFGKFVIISSLFYLGAYIAGPFFSVYMLKNLGFSFKIYMVINLSAAIFSILFMPIWGKFSDKYGNLALIKTGSILVSLMPFLWLFSSNPIYILLVPQLVSGIGWAAFNLGAGNYIYDAVSRERRGLCVSYYNLLVGVGVFIGANLGGLIAQYINISMNKFLLLFIISGTARLFSSLLFIPFIKEVRKVKKEKNMLIYFRKLALFSNLLSEVFGDIKVIGREIRNIRHGKL